MIAFLGVAFAQSVEAFDVDAETFRPSTDATRTLAVDDTRLPETWTVAAELVYQRNPFVFLPDGDGERSNIVRDALALHLMAGARIGPVRLGVTAPAYLLVTSDIADNRTVLGDPSIDLKVAVLEAPESGIGFALLGAVDLPMGGAASHLGSSSVAARAGAAVEWSSPRVYAILNGAFQVESAQEVRNTRVGSHLALKGAVGLQAADQVAVQVELLTRIGVLADANNDTPTEILLAAHRTHVGGPAPYLGVGAGLVPSIGSPVFRAVLGVRYRR